MHARAHGTTICKTPTLALRESGHFADIDTLEIGNTTRGRRTTRLRIWAAPGTGILLILSCAAILVGSSCKSHDGSGDSVAVECEISPRPVRIGSVTVTLRLKDSGGKPLLGARVALEANMSHAGMSPAFGEAKEVGMGQYQGRVELAMQGDWVVLMHVTLADGRKFDRQENVPGVGAN